jgi:hypothetical protein
MAMSGAPPVAIEGYVANTEVEVKDGNGNWVGADDLQYTNPETALRTLRWKSSIPGVVAGELQISLNPYPTRGEFAPCDEPEGGIVYRKQYPVGESTWQEIGNLDFSSILRQGRTLPPRDEVPPGIVPTDYIAAGATATDILTTGDSANVSPISEMDLKMIALGAPLYIRVVPVISGRGRACDLREDGVHGWVILAKLPKSGFVAPEPQPTPEVSHLEVTTQTYTPPTVDTWGDEVRKAGGGVYKVIKTHKLPPCQTKHYYAGWAGCNLSGNFPDWISYEYNKTTGNWDKVHRFDALGQALIDADSTWASPNEIVPAGLVFDYQVFHSSSCDFWCGAWNFASGFVTGLYNGVGGFVTWWAEAVESIKEGVASVVADVVEVLPGVGQLCKAAENVASCKSIIKAGMNYGLASMGLPPSLPNWEQLQQQGMDYLAGELAQEMASTTGLPPDITSLAADKTMELSKGMAQQTLEAMTEDRGKAFNGWNANWVINYDGVEPASRTISVRIKYAAWPYNYELPPNLYLRTSGFGSFKDPKVTGGSVDPFMANLYRPEDVHVPKKFPYGLVINEYGPALKIPIVLQPDYSTIPPPRCVDEGSGVECAASTSPKCWKYEGGAYKQVDCANYNTHIAIYYRNYWKENRLDGWQYSPCLHLSATAFTISMEDVIKQMVNPSIDPWVPFEPPFGVHAFTPSKEANTWTGAFYVHNTCQW